jgi:hypothetical protein
VRAGKTTCAEILDGLARDGWRAIDDVNTGRGNIDHTLLGSGGVLSIEPVGGMFCV